MIYTGIGSRQTPKVILDLMTEIGIYMAKNNILLRSGGANGADSAFESGCDFVNGIKEIFLPWEGFNNKTGLINKNNKKAMAISEKTWNLRNMPVKWNNLKESTKLLMLRNTYQIMGIELTKPTNLVICWTPDGRASGGTGQAIAMANYITISKRTNITIPVINLQIKKDRDIIENMLKNNIHPELILK